MMKRSKFGLSLNPSKRFLKELVLALAIIFIWYGVWAFLDIYLLPENPVLKVTVPMIVGLFLLYLLDEEEK